MKSLLILPLIFVLSACATLTDHRYNALIDHNAMMAHIEQQARMPVGAHPLDAYARVYTPVATGDIVGLFWVPPMFGDAKNFQPFELRAGQHRWRDSDANVAWRIDDGGCLVLDLVFDPKTDRVKSFECHGEA